MAPPSRALPGPLRRFATAAALPGGALVLAALVPPPGPDNRSLLHLPNLCPFRAATGLPCPGCGVSRALVCCAHGQWERAFVLHPVGPPLFLLCIGAVALALVRLRRPDALTGPLWQRAGTIAALALSAALLLLWPLRLLGIVAPPP